MKPLFPRSEFGKNVFTLLKGNVVAQLIPLLISPVLSRLYSPYDFGWWGTFMAIVSIVAIVVSARYEIAIMLPKREEEAINLFVLSVIICFILSILSFIIVFIYSFYAKKYFTQDSNMLKWFFLLPLMVFLLGIYQSLSNWANRKKQYHSIANYRIYNSIIVSITNLLFGFAGMNSIGLFLGTIAGSFISVSIFSKELFFDIKKNIGSVTNEKMIEMGRKYKVFPLTNSFQAVSDTFQLNGITYFISGFFGNTVTGSFSYATRILLAPMNFIGSGLAQVFYQQAIETHNSGGNLKNIVRNTIKKSFFIGLPILVIILLAAPQLFVFVFGEAWREAGVFAQILSPWLFLDFIRSPISQVPIILGIQKKLFLFSTIGNIILILSMLYAGLIVNDVIKGFYLFSCFQSLFLIFLIVWIYRISDNKN